MCEKVQQKLVKTIPREVFQNLKNKLDETNAANDHLEEKINLLESSFSERSSQLTTHVDTLNAQMEELTTIKRSQEREAQENISSLEQEVQSLKLSLEVANSATSPTTSSSNEIALANIEIETITEQFKAAKKQLAKSRAEHKASLLQHAAAEKDFMEKIEQLNAVIQNQENTANHLMESSRQDVADVVLQLRGTCDELDRANLSNYELETRLIQIEQEKKSIEWRSITDQKSLVALREERKENSFSLAKAEKDTVAAVAAATALASTLARIEKEKEDLCDSMEREAESQLLRMDIQSRERENERLLSKLKEAKSNLDESRVTIVQLRSKDVNVGGAAVRGGELDLVKLESWKKNEAIYQHEIKLLTSQLELQGARVSVDLYKMALAEAKEQSNAYSRTQQETEVLSRRVRELELINLKLKCQLPMSAEKKRRGVGVSEEQAPPDDWLKFSPTPTKLIGGGGDEAKGGKGTTPKNFSSVGGRRGIIQKLASSKGGGGGVLRSSPKNIKKTTTPSATKLQKRISPLQRKFLSSRHTTNNKANNKENSPL